MRFQTKQEATATTITVVAAIILGGSLVWLLTPIPSRTRINAGRKVQALRLEKEAKNLRDSLAETQAKIDPLLWKGTQEEIGPSALASVTKLAKAHGVRILAFRPQKTIEMGGLNQVPFSISTDGTYPNTMQFVKDLETNHTKLAVSLVQVAASDAATDQVTASITVVAYIQPKPPSAPAKSTKPKGGTSAQRS